MSTTTVPTHVPAVAKDGAVVELAPVSSLRRGDRFRQVGTHRWAEVAHQTATSVSGRGWSLHLDEIGHLEVEVVRGDYAPPAGTVRITGYTFSVRRAQLGGSPWAWHVDFDVSPTASAGELIVEHQVPYAWVDDVLTLLALEGSGQVVGPFARLDKLA